MAEYAPEVPEHGREWTEINRTYEEAPDLLQQLQQHARIDNRFNSGAGHVLHHQVTNESEYQYGGAGAYGELFGSQQFAPNLSTSGAADPDCNQWVNYEIICSDHTNNQKQQHNKQHDSDKFNDRKAEAKTTKPNKVINKTNNIKSNGWRSNIKDHPIKQKKNINIKDNRNMVKIFKHMPHMTISKKKIKHIFPLLINDKDFLVSTVLSGDFTPSSNFTSYNWPLHMIAQSLNEIILPLQDKTSRTATLDYIDPVVTLNRPLRCPTPLKLTLAC